jgi:hypothetical protein
MKKQILTIIIFTLAFFKGNATSIEKLSQVNKQWLTMPANQSLLQVSELPNYATFNDQISQHLSLVVQHLRAVSNKQWSATQQTNRENLLNQLDIYARQGIFPTNDFLPYQNPVFIDKKGVHCAVGYLMQQSGHENLAQEINHSQRFAYIKEITHPRLHDWANEQGFTTAELAWIQPAYISNEGMNKVSEGVDGEVVCMAKINANTAIIGGKFTKESKNNVICNNIALVIFNGTDYEISPIMNGVNGMVKALYVDGSIVYVGGSFTEANGISANYITKCDLLSSSQPFSSMGQLTNSVNAIIKHNNELLVASVSTNDLMSKWNGTSWVDANTGLYGNEVRCFKVFQNELYIGGDFELPTGALRTHIAIYNPAGIVNSSHFGLSNPVNCFEVFQNELYVGCDPAQGADSCIIGKLTANDWSPLFKFGNSLLGQKARILSLLTEGNSLHLYGNFFNNGLMYSSMHHARLQYQSGNAFIKAGVSLNNTASCSMIFNDKIIFGGNFTQNQVSGPNVSFASKIAYIDQAPLSITNFVSIDANCTLYPNPVGDILHIQHDDRFILSEAKVINLLGQTVLYPSINNKSINVGSLPFGAYRLILSFKDGISTNANFLRKE